MPHISLDLLKDNSAVDALRILARNGFFKPAGNLLNKFNLNLPDESYNYECMLCENKHEFLDKFVDTAIKKLTRFEFSTFLVGITLPFGVEEREDEFKAAFKVLYGENIRNEFGRSIGKRIVKKTNKQVDFRNPDLVILINPLTEKISIQAAPVFVGGTYRALVDNIPQSTWFCSTCRGKGCQKCDWSGKNSSETIEELFKKPFINFFSSNTATFHSSSHSNIVTDDFGSWKYFVMEVSSPKKRFVDITKLNSLVKVSSKGRLEILNLSFVDKSFIQKIKNSSQFPSKNPFQSNLKKR